MENHSAEEAKKKYDALPPEVKSLLYSPQMSFVIQQVGTKNKLHLDQVDLLNTETGQFMLGFVEPKDFPETLVEMLGIDLTQADAVVHDINEMLLTPIREAMKKVHADTDPQATIPKAAAAVTAPSVSEGKSVVMPSSIAKTVGAEMAHSTPAVIPAQTAPVVPPVATSTPPVTAPQPASITSPSITTPAEAAIMPTIIKPAGLPAMPKVDTMLTETTVSIASKPITPAPSASEATPATGAPAIAADTTKEEAPKPGPIYKTDPYHEPID